MTIVLSYIRLFFFLGGTLAGVQIPFFVDQYGKSLESHFLESQRAINEFQDDADKYFRGSIEQLVAHYKNSGDAVFSDGGDSIQAIYSRFLLLKQSLENFRSGAWPAYSQALFSPVADVQEEVRKNYSYAVKLNAESIVFGLFSGMVLAALVESVLRGVGLLGSALGRRSMMTP